VTRIAAARARLGQALAPWAVPAALLIGWQVASSLGWIGSKVLPSPAEVGLAFWHLARTGELWQALGVSFVRAVAGAVLGGLAGFVLGVLNGSSTRAALLLDGTLQMLRNIPHLAMIPMVILWFGIGEGAKLFLVALGVFFPVYLNTYHGIRTVDAGLLEMARVYGLDRRRLFLQVVLPGALPSILVGVRFALGIMWVTLIVAETVSASSGIGFMTMNAREFLETDVVVVGILLYALLGKLADVAARWTERRCLAWHPAYRPAVSP
jgi:sulfonate transport system permease protein